MGQISLDQYSAASDLKNKSREERTRRVGILNGLVHYELMTKREFPLFRKHRINAYDNGIDISTLEEKKEFLRDRLTDALEDENDNALRGTLEASLAEVEGAR